MLVPAGFPLNGAALCVTLGFQGGEVVLGVSAAGGPGIQRLRTVSSCQDDDQVPSI